MKAYEVEDAFLNRFHSVSFSVMEKFYPKEFWDEKGPEQFPFC